MAGKIFPDSANIWQDQAKVLFNYYRHAAERVVSEEERIENQVAALRQEEAQLNEKLGKVWIWLFALVIPYFITRVRDKNFMIFNQAKDIEYWAAFQGRLIYLYSLVLLIPEDKLPV